MEQREDKLIRMETERDTEKQRLIMTGGNRKTGRMMCREGLG